MFGTLVYRVYLCNVQNNINKIMLRTEKKINFIKANKNFLHFAEENDEKRKQQMLENICKAYLVKYFF